MAKPNKFSSYMHMCVRTWLDLHAHLLFLSLVCDDPVVERKLLLSPFSCSYCQAFLEAFLHPENRSQQVGCLTLILYPMLSEPSD